MTQALHRFDVLIIGSSFSGSLLAWILAQAGQRVLLVDRVQHPRFAIGESSTPLADYLVELISNRFGLPELHSLSRWGSWQRDLPELCAGQKRGFSYYQHVPGQSYRDDIQHRND